MGNFSNGEASGIPRGITRNARPYGLREWGWNKFIPAIKDSDDFFVVFPSQFTSVKILLNTEKPKSGLSDQEINYLGKELLAIFFDALIKFELELVEFYIRGIRKLATASGKKKEIYVDLPHVQVDILRAKKSNINDDYDLCQEIAEYIYGKSSVLVREMKRYYFDIKYETIYKIYRDCCPNPIDVFFLFVNEKVWEANCGWHISTKTPIFEDIKTRNF